MRFCQQHHHHTTGLSTLLWCHHERYQCISLVFLVLVGCTLIWMMLMARNVSKVLWGVSVWWWWGCGSVMLLLMVCGGTMVWWCCAGGQPIDEGMHDHKCSYDQHKRAHSNVSTPCSFYSTLLVSNIPLYAQPPTNTSVRSMDKQWGNTIAV